MSVFQFLRIIWARRMITLATTIATVVGAFIAILIVPPTYQAHSRVMLNILKPDPITGEIIPTNSTRTYVATQIELIRDYGVAGAAVDALGWPSNPAWIAEYQKAPSHEVIDIRRWLSQKIIDSTDVEIAPGTNILDIIYKSSTPTEAKAMADALRNAYMDSALSSRRKEATRTADWYTQQAGQEQAALNAAEQAKTAYEKANGIVMQADNTDVDTARLRALSGQGNIATPIIPAIAPTSPAAVELAQLDASITQASQNLGPNHPQMIALKARRAIVAQVAAQDAAAQRSAQMAAAGAGAGAFERAVNDATSKVIAKRDKIEHLNQLQTEVNLRRDQYTKSLGRIADLRKQAAVADSGIASLGEAVTPQEPSFPKKPLVLGGSLALGLALGLLLSLLTELFARRVRSAEDLSSALPVPVMAILTDKTGASAGLRLGGLRPSTWFGRRRAAQA